MFKKGDPKKYLERKNHLFGMLPKLLHELALIERNGKGIGEIVVDLIRALSTREEMEEGKKIYEAIIYGAPISVPEYIIIEEPRQLPISNLRLCIVGDVLFFRVNYKSSGFGIRSETETELIFGWPEEKVKFGELPWVVLEVGGDCFKPIRLPNGEIAIIFTYNRLWWIYYPGRNEFSSSLNSLLEIIEGKFSRDDVEAIKNHLENPIDNRKWTDLKRGVPFLVKIGDVCYEILFSPYGKIFLIEK